MTIKEEIQIEEYKRAFAEAYKQGFIDAISMCKIEPSNSEKPNNCEHITEDGVTCAKYPSCDDCTDNPLNKIKGSERLLKGKDEPQTSKIIEAYSRGFEDGAEAVKAVPQTERSE